jgi:hypothetical protein
MKPSEKRHDPQQQLCEGHIHQHDEKGNAVHTRVVRHLNQIELAILRIAQETPGKAREEIGAEQFERDPEAGSKENSIARDELTQPDDGEAIEPNIESEIGGQQQQNCVTHRFGHLAIGRHGGDDPGHDAGESDKAAQPTDPKGPLSGTLIERELKGNQDKPGQQSKVKIRKAERQEQPARAGKEDMARTRLVHRAVPYPKDSMTCKRTLEQSATWKARHVLFSVERGMVVPMERRRHPRVPAQVKSLLRANSHDVEGEALDLSIGGARIKSSLVVQPGRQIAVKLIVPGDDVPIVIEQAQVQWAVDRTFGVRFIDLQPQELDDLERLVDECIALDEGREA